jgi:GntR family transcriptional regulator, gluconate operon transcriptional repressor
MTDKDGGRAFELAPLRAESVSTQAADAIRRLIVSGTLRGGQRLVEARIAEQLSVSRGPVRDAFRQLREEGLLRDEPRRGTYVVSLGPEDVRDLLDLRAGLEAQAAGMVAERHSSGDIRALEGGLVAIRGATLAGDASAINAADFAFHETICRLSGSHRLLGTFVRYATELRVLLRSEQEGLALDGRDKVAEHEALVAVLRAGDRLEAQEAFRKHIADARDRLIEQMTTKSRASVS